MEKKIYDIKPPEKKQTKKERKKKERKKRGKGFFIGVFITLLVIFGVIYFFSFRAEIRIWPHTEGVELERSRAVSIEAESVNDDELPGTIFETDFLEEYRTFQATGFEDEETHARGTLIIENRQWDQNQPLVENTRFESEDGEIFRATDGVLVPARSHQTGSVTPGTVEVEVVADSPGPDYNIEPTEFRLPGLQGAPSYQNVTAYSEDAMTGGARGERTVVSEEDVENAREAITSSLLAEGEEILARKEEEGFLFDDENQFNYQIEEEEMSHRAGEATEEFDFKMRARIEAITLSGEVFEDYLIDEILESVQESSENNMKGEKRVYEKSLSYNYVFENIDWERGTGDMEIELAGEVYSEINRSRLIERARGSSRNELEAFLERQDFIRQANVMLRPFGWTNIPDDSGRINIFLEF